MADHQRLRCLQRRWPRADRNTPDHCRARTAPAQRKSCSNWPPKPHPQPWIAARDTAVLTLLYGCGLHFSEALGPGSRLAPARGADHSRQGRQGTSGPVLPVARDAIETYLDTARGRWNAQDGPLFAAPATPAQPASGLGGDAALATGAGPAADRDPACAAPFLRRTICWRRAAICARFRNCWAMPACRRPGLYRRRRRHLLAIYRAAHPRAWQPRRRFLLHPNIHPQRRRRTTRCCSS